MACGASHAGENLAAAIERIRDQANIPVVAYATFDANKVHTARVIGAERDVYLRWGSITKTITAITLLRLLEQSGTDPATPLQQIVGPGYVNNPWQRTHPIRLMQLLQLSAGLPDLSPREFDQTEPMSLAAALAINPEHRRTRWPPGMHHSYSNIAPGLAQLVIERLTAASFDAAAQALAFEPLHMNRATLRPVAGLAGGFRKDGQTPIPYWHMTFPAFGAMNAPIDDLVRLGQALLGNGRLDSSVRRQMFTPASTLAARQGFTFEYGAGVYPRIAAGHVWWGHGGDADGYRSRLGVNLHLGSGYVVNINTDNPGALRRLQTELEATLAPKPRPSAPAQPVDHRAVQPWLGAYAHATRRFGTLSAEPVAQLSLTRDNRALVFKRGERHTKLNQISPGRYARQQDPVATVALVSEDGAHYVQGVLGNYVRVPVARKNTDPERD